MENPFNRLKSYFSGRNFAPKKKTLVEVGGVCSHGNPTLLVFFSILLMLKETVNLVMGFFQVFNTFVWQAWQPCYVQRCAKVDPMLAKADHTMQSKSKAKQSKAWEGLLLGF
jgi:hypothetical protein